MDLRRGARAGPFEDDHVGSPSAGRAEGGLGALARQLDLDSVITADVGRKPASTPVLVLEGTAPR